MDSPDSHYGAIPAILSSRAKRGISKSGKTLEIPRFARNDKPAFLDESHHNENSWLPYPRPISLPVGCRTALPRLLFSGRTNGQPVFVYSAQVLINGPASFAYFDFSETVTVAVTSHRPVATASIRPTSYGIKHELKDLVIHACDSGTISNIRFENIRVEESKRFVRMWIGQDMWGTDDTRGHIKDILFHDISRSGGEPPTSEITGFDATHLVEDVTFDTLRMYGKPIKNADEGKYGDPPRRAEGLSHHRAALRRGRVGALTVRLSCCFGRRDTLCFDHADP